MIATAATSADALVPWGNAVWSVIAGAGIALWILLGIKNLDKVNRVIMAALLLLTLFLSRLVFDGIPQPVSGGYNLRRSSRVGCSHALVVVASYCRLYAYG